MNKTHKLLIGLSAVAIVAAAAFYFLLLKDGQMPAAVPAASEHDETPTAAIDVDKALAERVLGDPNAPVRIAEHSSLTCPHCAHFHQETFAKIKSQWIDTGQAYLAFSDFPLNAPALHASMTARCLPEGKFFDFIDMLYKTQDQWAFAEDYLDRLQEMAAGFGLDAAAFKACIASTELREGLIKRMNTVQAMWKISSTPSFVINNKTVVTGAVSPGDFSRKIEESRSEGGGSQGAGGAE